MVSNHKIGDSKLEKLLKRQVLYKNAAAFRSAGISPQTPASNNISPKSKNGNTELYAGIPVNKLFEGADYIEKQVGKRLEGNLGDIWDRTFNDPEKVFLKMGKEKYYNLVKRAFEKQERLEKGYRKSFI